jgi:3-methyladenine DNA glycosylase/8-oxoguanine DNA glycosylase
MAGDGRKRLLDTVVRPRGPYSLRLSAGRAGDATRRFRAGRLVALLPTSDGPEAVAASQFPDGRVRLQASSKEGLERLHQVLGLHDDHSGFVLRFGRDELLGRTIRELRGLRPIRVGSVAQALLRAVAGQLITSRRARAIELRVIRATTPERGGLHPPPLERDLGAVSPAELQRLGLTARKSSTIVRVCRTTDLERLHSLPSAAVAGRIERERGLGPWSAGVILLEGLGRFERGLVGDLGLMKLCAALRGRWVEPWETAELLEPYGEWAGLASVYLLAGAGRGLIPVNRDRIRTMRRASGRPVPA